jgi:integrase/recombinase XerD
MTKTTSSADHARFSEQYQRHLKHLKLKGLQPKTIDAYARAVRRAGAFFHERLDALSESDLLGYFNQLVGSHSWSTIKLDWYGLQFFTEHVLKQAWSAPKLISPPKSQRLPDIVTIAEADRIFAATRVLSYRVFYFTIYSMGLRLSEGLNLQVGDIDAARARVHIRDSKGNKDRFVPLPTVTLDLLRRFWAVHRHPRLLFPNRSQGLRVAADVDSPLDRGGVQNTLRAVVQSCGLKKTSPRTAFATAMPHI